MDKNTFGVRVIWSVILTFHNSNEKCEIEFLLQASYSVDLSVYVYAGWTALFMNGTCVYSTNFFLFANKRSKHAGSAGGTLKFTDTTG